MKKIIIGILIFALVIATAIYYFTKSNDTNVAIEPKKNTAIPKEAIWYGGADGGVWALVNEGNKTNVFSIKVYNQSDGSLWVEGDFKVSENCAATTLSVEEIRKLINGFDGDNFILNTEKDGKYCSLVPVK